MQLELNDLELISVTCVDCHITFAPSVAARFFARQAARWERLEQWASSAPVLATAPHDVESVP